MKFTRLLSVMFFLLSAPAWAGRSLTGTITSAGHGFVSIMTADCHQVSLSTGDMDNSALFAWAWKPGTKAIHVTTYTDSFTRLETIRTLQKLGAQPDYITKCARETNVIGAHADGVITDWSSGNAVGAFDLRTSGGALRTFEFEAGSEPLINGHHVSCYLSSASPASCTVKNYLVFNRTRVRVFYRIVDSPNGTATVATHITTLR
jgi:hypothetical protein